MRTAISSRKVASVHDRPDRDRRERILLGYIDWLLYEALGVRGLPPFTGGFTVPEGEEAPVASRDSEGRLSGDCRLSTPGRRQSSLNGR
jgi:hypothetical protein